MRHGAEEFLYRLSSGYGHEYTREELLQLHEELDKNSGLKARKDVIEKASTERILEEVMKIALKVKYEYDYKRLIEKVTPGREEFEALVRRCPAATAAYRKYHSGDVSWAAAVNYTYAHLREQMSAYKAEYIPVPPDSLQDKVRLCTLLYDVVEYAMRAQIKNIDPVTIVLDK